MPYKNPLGATYDCGDFATNMEKALKLGDVAGFARRRDESRRRGKLRGLAIVNPIEQAAGPQPEFAEIRFAPSGSATVLMGSKNQGQGHETTFKQILNERARPRSGRRAATSTATRTGSPSAWARWARARPSSAAPRLWQAADKVIAKGKKIAARLLEAAEADVTFADGKFGVVGTDRAVGLKEVARAAFQPQSAPAGVEPGLYETGTFSPKQATWPNGCHVCEVEVDPDSGAVAIVSYAIVDDVGTVINPVTLKGQIHGGVAQGVGQALMEQVVYDRESGQLLTASFMDYAMPRGDTFPDMHIESNPAPTKLNPLGAKGAGEAGTVGALPAVIERGDRRARARSASGSSTCPPRPSACGRRSRTRSRTDNDQEELRERSTRRPSTSFFSRPGRRTAGSRRRSPTISCGRSTRSCGRARRAPTRARRESSSSEPRRRRRGCSRR